MQMSAVHLSREMAPLSRMSQAKVVQMALAVQAPVRATLNTDCGPRIALAMTDNVQIESQRMRKHADERFEELRHTDPTIQEARPTNSLTRQAKPDDSVRSDWHLSRRGD